MISFQNKNFGLIRRYPIVGGRRLSNYLWSVVIFLGGCGFLLTGVSSYFNRNLLLVTPKLEHATHTILSDPKVRVNNPKVALQTFTYSSYPSWGIISLPYPKGIDEQAKIYLSEEVPKDLHILSKAWLPSDPEVSKSKAPFSTFAQQPKENKDGLEVINGVPSLSFFPQGLVLSFYGFFGLCFSFHLWFTLIWKIGVGFNEFNGKDKYVRIFRWGRPGKNRRIDFKYTKEWIETLKIELIPNPALFLHVKGEKDIPLTNAALIGEFIPLEDLETQATELTSLLQIPLEIAD